MKDVIALLNDQRSELLDSVARIDAAISALGGKPGRSASSPQSAKGTRKRRELSAEAKKAVSERMKNYWADRRRQAAAGASGDAGNVEDETTETVGTP